MTKLEREGPTSAVTSASLVETIAEFEYSEFDDNAAPARTGTAPTSLGLGRSHSEGENEEATSKTVILIADVTGDGLPDVLDAADAASGDSSAWEVRHQKVDHDARTFSFEGARDVNATDKALLR